MPARFTSVRGARRARVSLLVLGAAAYAAACAPAAPRAIDYGREQCGYCRMTVGDPRFSAQLETRAGRVHAFDSIECLAAFAGAQDSADVTGAWVGDFARPGTWVRVDSAAFYRVRGVNSPMGKGLVASARGAAPANVANPGAPMSWADVRALVAREGMRGGRHAH